VSTVWAFKRKVKVQIADLEIRGRKPSISRWQDVILTEESRIVRPPKKNKDYLPKIK
jgi:hypothetical protein